MIGPCSSCPWKKSTRTEDIPGGGMDHARSIWLERCGQAMACHLSTDDKPSPCAGFVVSQDGAHSLALRIAHVAGYANLNEFWAGGEDLYASMREMLAAHPDGPASE